MSRIRLQARAESFKLANPFTISRGSRTTAEVVSVSLQADGHSGRGECVPYARYGESMDSVLAEIEAQRSALEAGLDREALQTAMPAGAARNALDCALWDLESQRSGTPVWQLAGLTSPAPVTTAYTLSLETPAAMQASAAAEAARPLLKVKLGGDGEMDVQRLQAVRAGAPESVLIVDANEGWSAEEYDALAPVMLELGVALVEQPLPADDDEALAGRARPLPVCADEACHTRDTLLSLSGKYDVVNIKLDKTGGLTEALALSATAREMGFGVMVGCMVSTSLSMAPAVLVAQSADYVDLDGPLLLGEDRPTPLQIDGSLLYPPTAGLWGS